VEPVAPMMVKCELESRGNEASSEGSLARIIRTVSVASGILRSGETTELYMMNRTGGLFDITVRSRCVAVKISLHIVFRHK
jgi:hypothetical protein